MPNIADQVATIEHDLTAALAQIDALTATNSALASANASLQRDNVGLQLAINDMQHYVDDTRTMAEKLAESALDMLRASRRQVGTPAEVIPFAKPERTTTKHEALGAPYGVTVVQDRSGDEHRKQAIHEGISDLIDADPRFREPPAQQAVAEIMASDSGDEQAERAVGKSPLLAAPYGIALAELEGYPLTGFKAGDEQPAPMHVMQGRDVGTPMPINSFGPSPIFLTRSTPYSPERAIFG